MADDVTLPGDGSVVATDEVDGRHYQLVKLVVGGEGEAALLSRDSPQPVVDELAQALLRLIYAKLSTPTGYNPGTGRTAVNATIDSGTISSVSSVSSVSTVSTVTTVTGLNNIDSISGRVLMNATSLSAWAAAVRARIT